MIRERWLDTPVMKDGYVLEHRKIMSEHLGRPLEPNELVHHINSDKTDNRVENLELSTREIHASHHGKKRVYNRAWTDDEDCRLKELWVADVSKEEIELEFDRTWNAIKLRARKLKVRRPDSQKRGAGRKRK